MELRTALIIIGLVIIVIIAVVTFRKGQKNPFSRRQKDEFMLNPRTDEIDPLFAPGASVSRADIDMPVEPEPMDDTASIMLNEDVELALQEEERQLSIEPDPALTDGQSSGHAERVTPAMEKTVASTEEAGPSGTTHQPSLRRRDHRPEKSIDYVALIRGSEPIRRDQALGVYRQHEYHMDKPSYIYGFNISTGLWRDLEHEPESGEYRDICLAIQMADADGPISDSELHRFSQMSLAVAEELERPILFSLDHDEALAYARDLDKFCADTDLLVIFNLIARSEQGFSLRAIHREADKLGLTYTDDGIYQKLGQDSDGKPVVLYSIASMYKPGVLSRDEHAPNTSGLSLFMQVTEVGNPAKIFNTMMEDMALLAKRLNGVLVDQERKPLNEAGLKLIHDKIVDTARRMEARGIPPGSPVAHRLY